MCTITIQPIRILISIIFAIVIICNHNNNGEKMCLAELPQRSSNSRVLPGSSWDVPKRPQDLIACTHYHCAAWPWLGGHRMRASASANIPFHKTHIPTHLHYITLHYTTLHYITLHYTTLHYITLHYTTLHYITYIYVCIHICMCVCLCTYIIYIYTHILNTCIILMYTLQRYNYTHAG